MAKRKATVKEFRRVLEDLINGMSRVFDSSEHKAIYSSAYVHGVKLSEGNNFGKELKAAKKLLEETK